MRLRASLPDFAERLLVTLWAGGMWAVGFVAAPLLFRLTDDRALAGRFAGALFEALGWLGLLCGGLLLVLVLSCSRQRRLTKAAVVAVMIGITASGQFVLYPEMSVIRDTAGALASESGHARFAFLHGVSSALFLANSVLAAALVWLETPHRD